MKHQTSVCTEATSVFCSTSFHSSLLWLYGLPFKSPLCGSLQAFKINGLPLSETMRISLALTKINLGRERWKQPSAEGLWPLIQTNKSTGLSLSFSAARFSFYCVVDQFMFCLKKINQFYYNVSLIFVALMFLPVSYDDILLDKWTALTKNINLHQDRCVN